MNFEPPSSSGCYNNSIWLFFGIRFFVFDAVVMFSQNADALLMNRLTMSTYQKGLNVSGMD